MSERSSAITHEIYQLLCELKLLLLRIGSERVRSDIHAAVLHLLVALRRYSDFFGLKEISMVSQEMKQQWESIPPGESRREVIDLMFNRADHLATQLLADATGHTERP